VGFSFYPEKMIKFVCRNQRNIAYTPCVAGNTLLFSAFSAVTSLSSFFLHFFFAFHLISLALSFYQLALFLRTHTKTKYTEQARKKWRRNFLIIKCVYPELIVFFVVVSFTLAAVPKK